MKQHQKKMLNEYLEHGEFDSSQSSFWEESDNRYIDKDYL
jgi:hypothetical protein